MLIGIALLLCSVTQALTLEIQTCAFEQRCYNKGDCRIVEEHTYANCQEYLDNVRVKCFNDGFPKDVCEAFDFGKCLSKEVSYKLLKEELAVVSCFEEGNNPYGYETDEPTALPTENPSSRPSEDPTAVPTTQPTEDPSSRPSEDPTAVPTMQPTEFPSSRPSQAPTEHASPPTDSPTEQDTGKVCDAVREWTKETADSNCVASSFPSKNFGIRACKSRFQMKLEMSLANKLYTSCGSRCVYDYNSLMANGKEAFLYRRRKKCYKRVTKGGCFKMYYGVAMGRAKKLCSY